MPSTHNQSFFALDIHAQKRIDSLCDIFESEWQSDNQYRIENLESKLLPEWKQAATDELILLEVELRFTSSELPAMQEYFDRFPKSNDAVRAAFERVFSLGIANKSQPSTEETYVEAGSNLSKEVDHSGFQVRGDSEDSIPERINEFAIKEKLGSGSFGVVYRAFDENNDRDVALKFPLNREFGDEKIRLDFVREAESASRLRHPGIVATYEIRQDGGLLFMVQQLVDGQELKAYSKSKLSHREAVGLVADIAEAVGYAHRNGIYHRDLKPSNILIDRNGKPLVTDFGMAIHESLQHQRRGERAGSPAYMSPELVRGESHLIDGRSDIWSLGVVLYELLIDRRPFSDESMSALFDQIKIRETVPLRQFDETVPVELERICLRCLAKKISERYLTASDLADELRKWLQNPSVQDQPAAIAKHLIPQGLRAFGADDADSFVNLLPGPRGSSGLPMSVWFWKKRIESTAPETTFSTGLLYGPSGSGKSSFVRAGILPRLSKQVLPIYVEATSNDTEVRILKAIRRHFSDVPLNYSLPEVLAGLRQRRWNRQHTKVVLILDQFEQWLHSHEVAVHEQLLEALRQCDGVSLQSLILVRDDFWLATSRFKDALDVEFVDGHNAMLVDRFDQPHARNVLTQFGRAFQQLPERDSELSASQDEFLSKVVEDLAEEGHVISVRLALFAEMFKNREWTTKELRKVGGISGVGETFLDETFSRKTALPRYRNRAATARTMLEQLLPDTATTIKGRMRTEVELAEACGLATNDREFQDVIEILVKELRLVTPTEPNIAESSAGLANGDSAERYFQLTHDYLVVPIRNWLNRKKKESWRGRAALRLRELAALHEQSNEKRFLPNLPEFAAMRLGVPAREQSDPGKQVMKLATRRHALGLAAWGTVGAAVFGVGSVVRRNLRNEKADSLVERLLDCEPYSFDEVFNQLLPYQDRVVAKFAEFHDDSDQRVRFNALVASARMAPNQPVIEKLAKQLDSLTSNDSRLCVSAFKADTGLSTQVLQETLVDSSESKVKNRCATLLLHLAQTDALESILAYSENASERTEWIHQLKDWSGDLQTIATFLEDTNEPATVSGLLIALSEIEFGELKPAIRKQLIDAAKEIYLNHHDASCHAAAEYLLRNSSNELPTQVQVRQANWRVVNGIQMVRIPKGTLYRGYGIPVVAQDSDDLPEAEFEIESFWISDKEVTVTAFLEFLNCKDYPYAKPSPSGQNSINGDGAGMISWDSQKLDDGTPVADVSIVDISMFCRWLNWKAGIEGGMKADDPRTVHCDLSKPGFRLPTHEELDYVTRAGTNTPYFFGELEQRPYLPLYASVGGNSSSVVQPSAQSGGKRIPNQFGVFDSHGSMSELCLLDIALFEKENGPIKRPGRRGVNYGNDFHSNSRHFCGNFEYFDVNVRQLTVGFRVAFNS